MEGAPRSPLCAARPSPRPELPPRLSPAPRAAAPRTPPLAAAPPRVTLPGRLRPAPPLPPTGKQKKLPAGAERRGRRLLCTERPARERGARPLPARGATPARAPASAGASSARAPHEPDSACLAPPGPPRAPPSRPTAGSHWPRRRGGGSRRRI